jgi:secreted PhoX family phosphatase
MSQPLDPQAMDDESVNPSDNRAFQDVVAKRFSRRQVLAGGLGLMSLALFGRVESASKADTSPLLGFRAVPVSAADTLVVPEGYRAQVMIPWGEPILGDFPAFDVRNTAAQQAMQVGTHHDGMHYFPIEGIDPWQGSSVDGLLVLNHEYCEPRLMDVSAQGQALASSASPVKADGSRDADPVLKEINAHGVSIVRIQLDANEQWQVTPDPRNRRITARTEMVFSGPLRGHESLRTRYSVDGTKTRGTLNNCSHGVTPWNTYLTCEENFRFYFHADDPRSLPPHLTRYRVGAAVWTWHLAADKTDEAARFDITPRGHTATDDYRNEANGFGFIVEIDPFDPDSTPIKRTHLGRFSHEGVVFAPVVEGQPLVCYSGDDTAGEYIYKYVSRNNYHKATANGALLDDGTLYVARFHEDGSGEWLALVPGQNGLGADNGFGTLQDILLNSRGAADIAGATPMDRPEWGAVDPGTGLVYFTLTNYGERSPEDARGPNPRGPNHFGQIVRWSEQEAHHGTRFDWDLFVIAGPSHDSQDMHGNPLTADSIFAMPDGLTFDADRRLWIQTDIPEASTNRAPYLEVGNNAMLAADPDTGEIRRFLTGPVGQEITGCASTPDQSTLFVNVQHPGGAVTTAQQFAAGEHSSHWPDGGNSIPRSATVAIRKRGGGKVGS